MINACHGGNVRAVTQYSVNLRRFEATRPDLAREGDPCIWKSTDGTLSTLATTLANAAILTGVQMTEIAHRMQPYADVVLNEACRLLDVASAELFANATLVFLAPWREGQQLTQGFKADSQVDHVIEEARDRYDPCTGQ